MEYLTRYAIGKRLGYNEAFEVISLEKKGLIKPDKVEKTRHGISHLYREDRIPEIKQLLADTEYTEAQFIKKLGWNRTLFIHHKEEGRIRPTIVIERKRGKTSYYNKKEVKRVMELIRISNQFILPNENQENQRLYPLKEFSKRIGINEERIRELYEAGVLMPSEIRTVRGMDILYFNSSQIKKVKSIVERMDEEKEKYKYKQEEVRDTKSLQERLLLLRRILGLNQAKFAKMLGLSRQTYNKYEANPENFTPEHLDTIVEKTNITRKWLLYGKISIFKDE